MMRAFWLRPIASILITTLAACSDEQPSAPPQATAEKSQAGSEPNQADDWLELSEGVSAPDWLAARSEAHGKTLSAQDRTELAKALSTAALRLGESPRMIANRSVQLETMLRDIGQRQPAIELIEQLTSTIGETGQTEGFGAISQHYYIMRKGGLSADQALDDLKRRYGPRS